MEEDLIKVKTKITWEVGSRKGEYIDGFGFCWREKDEAEDVFNDYWWTEGNGACDCNRSVMFLNEKWECGSKIKIINITALPKDKERNEYEKVLARP